LSLDHLMESIERWTIIASFGTRNAIIHQFRRDGISHAMGS